MKNELLNVLQRNFKPLQSFELKDVYDLVIDKFALIWPDNNTLHATVRRTLQNLRNDGYLTFVNNRGMYKLAQ